MLLGMLRTLFFLALLSGLAHAHIFATYNIRYDNSGDASRGNAWNERGSVIAKMVRFHGFDLFGTQEGFLHQMQDLQKLLPEHALLTHGRDDGKDKGEHVGIFYRKDKFKLLNSGRFWLSETPEKASTGWDAALPRLCTWGEFSDLAAKKSFYVFNIHFDHRGAKARRESAKLLREMARKIAGDSPVILLGDFNSGQDSKVHQILADKKIFTAAFELSPIKLATVGTANGFDPNADTQTRIDHLFLTKHFRVERYGILTDSYRSQNNMSSDKEAGSRNFPKEIRFEKSLARLPSDHFPVVIKAEWIKP